jgi:cell wall-associated NlpC family hydrolase
MPTPLRGLLLALALVLVAFGCTATPGVTTARSPAGERAPAGPPRHTVVKRPVPKPKRKPRPKRKAKPKPSLGARAVRFALEAVGVPYQWGGSGHGRMVHAPSSGRAVEVVSLRRPYFGDRLIGARRVVPA